MKCKHIERKIIDYLEGNVSKSEQTQIEEHVRKCKKCTMMLQEFSSLWDYVTSPAKPELNPFFWTRLQAEISEREKAKMAYFVIFESAYKYLKPAVCTGLLVFGIVFGYNLGKSYVDVRMLQQEVEEPVYVTMFDYLPEGSIGDIYLNYYNEY